mgnify:FL=1
MKRIAATVISITVALCMFGCYAKKIDGTPADVIEECQSVKEDENVLVTVTGYVGSDDIDVSTSSFDDSKFVFVSVSEDEVERYAFTGDPIYKMPDIYVSCMFNDENEFDEACDLHVNEMVTITGELNTSGIHDDNVLITGCKIE